MEGMQYRGGTPSAQTWMCSADQAYHSTRGTSSVQAQVRSMVEGVQCRPVTPSVQRRHIISADEGVQCRPVTPSVQRRHIFSADEGVQYRGRTASLQMRMCVTDLSHHQYSGWCTVWISYIISTDESFKYMPSKTAQEVAGGYIYVGK